MRPWSHLWLLLAVTVLPAQQRPADLAAELRRWSATMEAGTTVDAATLPAEWSVDVSDETFTISTAPLRAYFQSGPKKQQGAEVRAWLELLAASLDSGTTAESDPSAAVKLKRILARPEFRPPNPPSEWELFWKEFGRWVEALLDKLFGFTGRHPGSIQLFLWALLVGANGVLVYLLMHTWRHETRASPLRDDCRIPPELRSVDRRRPIRPAQGRHRRVHPVLLLGGRYTPAGGGDPAAALRPHTARTPPFAGRPAGVEGRAEYPLHSPGALLVRPRHA